MVCVAVRTLPLYVPETVHFRLGFLLSMLKNAASYILLHLPLLSKVMIREGSASVETSTV